LVKPIKATMSKVVLITGGSSEGHWRVFTSQGFVVYGTSRNPERVEFYFSISHFRCSKFRIKLLLQKIIASSGRLDIVINNAGVGITGPLEEIPSEEIKKTLRLTSSDLLK
jgi:NAD(P)-dependent dehydrogenase (short-subunit alcohol dehydrogenase family)